MAKIGLAMQKIFAIVSHIEINLRIKQMNLLEVSSPTRIQENMILERASEILQARYVSDVCFTSPQLVVRYLKARLEHLEHEEFHALFLDTQHKLIKAEVLAKGTIDGAAVYPREVLKAALNCNAAAVVFAHNHPSGIAEASQADRAITKRLIEALALVDIRTLDHIIIGHGEFQSFAEKGWIES